MRVTTKNAFTLAILAMLIAACGHTPNYPDQYYRGDTHSHARIGKKVAKVASNMVGVRYRYGGNTPRKGFDCSGLVQYSYKKAGIRVPRNTRLQRLHSFRITYRQLRKGDLLFFNQLGRRASHVGIYVGNNRFIHAPSRGKRIRVSVLSKEYWQRHLESIRRFNIR